MLSKGKLWVILLLALAAAGLVGHALHYPFITDDAYISFRYSYNLAEGGQLTFNPGERVEGYTNFLWTVILGLLLKAGVAPELSSRVLGAFFGVLGLGLIFLFTRLYRGGRLSGWDALAPPLLAATAGYAVWCSGGLETQLFVALSLGGATLYLAEHAGRVRWRLSGLLFALAAMTRPEGLLLFGLTGLHRLGANLLGQRRLRPTRAELGWLAGFVLPLAAFFLWRYSYYGYPLPNTFYVKAGGGAAASVSKWGLPYLWDFVRENHLYALAPLLLALLFVRPRTVGHEGVRRAASSSPAAATVPLRPAGPAGIRPAFVWSYVLLWLVPYTAYVVIVGGDFMAMGRFFVPMLPFWAFIAQEGLRELSELPRRRDPQTWRPWRLAFIAAVVLGLQVANSVRLYRQNQQLSYYRWGLDTIAYLDKFAADRILVGRWLREHLPPDTYLAVGGAGAIVYASRMRALDTFGLNDAWIAHHARPVGQRPGHTKSAPESYLLEQQPDLMCHQAKHQVRPYRPPPRDEQYWRQRGYSWVCLAPPGLQPAYYCCLKRMDRDLGTFAAEVGS